MGIVQQQARNGGLMARFEKKKKLLKTRVIININNYNRTGT